jgi:hypothetical protein
MGRGELLKMEAAYSPEKMISTYKVTWFITQNTMV